MHDDTAVLIPYRPTDAWRADAFAHVTRQLTAASWAWAAGDTPGTWCKAAAVYQARLSVPHAEILVIHDADCLVADDALVAAVSAVRAGAPWAVPHREVYRLDAATTRQFLDGTPTDRRGYARRPYIGIAGGGITVVAAAAYDTCPLDDRFLGWGSEDQAWGWALETLHGPPWRGDAPLTHLWHPHPAPRAPRSPLPESARLWRAYRASRRRPSQMRDLVTRQA